MMNRHSICFFGNRFLSMTDYATNYCIYESIKCIQDKSIFLQTRTTNQDDVQKTYFWISIRATKSCFINEKKIKYIIKDVYMHVGQRISTFFELHNGLKFISIYY